MDSEVILLVEEGFEEEHFISLLDECHPSAQHSLICTCGNRDLRVWIDLPAHDWAVGIRYGLLQPRPAL